MRRQSKKARRGSRYWLAAWVVLVLLLALPFRALLVIGAAVGFAYVFGYLFLVSAITALLFRADKRKAQEGAWRVSEGNLHLLELLGGWPGGYMAQRVYCHKTAKARYQVTFWFIVLLHQYAAIDFVQGWKWTGSAYSALRSFAGS